MCSFLDLHINPESRREGLLKANAHAKPDDGGKRAVGYGGRDKDRDNGYIVSVSQRGDVDIG